MNEGRVKRELRNRWLALRLAVGGRVFQYPEILALRRFLSAFAVDALFDVGANAGQYATMLRRDVGFSGLIFSFEPNPDVFARLHARAVSDPRWHVFNMALSDHDGVVPFHIMAADQFSSIEKPAEAMEAVFVERNKVERVVDMQCRRLDTLLPELREQHGFARPFLKMDTQGHDKAVCDGAGDRLADMLGVQTELAVRRLYAGGTDYRAMIAMLEERGFAPNAFFANNKGHFPLLVEMDGIFVRADLTDETA
ncbi:FkbM family methyltransferase [Sphingobium subterraneum]|uniref:FkbM family methyltransferase n=1 Tax=Sphingobium subterraneum TaxID=627688 RepID=A0A841IV53_9SPHN|nr:FkbM family methyltransferase [Sphingobium subterraneum]MBB6122799.1 FkbM family methyltransferase [Sphingobium subterraneum]